MISVDLGPGWEKKALIVLGILTLIIVIYAYNPFQSTGDVEVQNQTTETTETPVETPAPQPAVSDNTTSDNTTNINITNETNGTFQISADEAKKIVTTSNSGYTAGEPTQGTVTINNNAISVWIVPLMKNNIVSKKVYVDATSGTIVGNEEVKT